jgi:hypothetical protein
MIIAGGTIDFGLLDEASQKKVIRLLLSDSANRKQMLLLNPLLSNIGKVRNAKEVIQTNRQAVLRNYGMEGYRQKLLSTYRCTAATSIRHRIDRKKLLRAFFDLNKFSLLKWGDYEVC